MAIRGFWAFQAPTIFASFWVDTPPKVYKENADAQQSKHQYLTKLGSLGRLTKTFLEKNKKRAERENSEEETSEESPLEILKKKFAKGKISEEEFKK